MKKQNTYITALIAAALSAISVSAQNEDRIQAMEKQLAAMNNEIKELRNEQLERNDLSFLEKEVSKLHFGGYGEIHANFKEGGDDQFDIHRLVLYLGYDFADWIKLTSEIELEHGFVSDSDSGENGGELSVEQLYVDFLFSDWMNARVGRMLAPMGIINQNHEPTLFMGVERPNVDKYIIPSTWSVDGAGLYGYPLSWLSYQAYVVGGLDGEGFDGKEGVRGGRIKERSDLSDVAITGRLDLYPIVDADLPADQALRIGLSGYYGGTDNSNKGGGNGVHNDFSMYAVDFEYDISRFNLIGVFAYGENSDAEDLNLAFGKNVGKELLGWYLQGAVRVLPDSWKKGKLAEADLVPFVRYESYNTQHEVPANGVKNGAWDRSEYTVGVNVPLTRNFIVKADYQFLDDKGTRNRANQFNLGMGWVIQ